MKLEVYQFQVFQKFQVMLFFKSENLYILSAEIGLRIHPDLLLIIFLNSLNSNATSFAHNVQSKCGEGNLDITLSARVVHHRHDGF